MLFPFQACIMCGHKAMFMVYIRAQTLNHASTLLMQCLSHCVMSCVRKQTRHSNFILGKHSHPSFVALHYNIVVIAQQCEMPPQAMQSLAQSKQQCITCAFLDQGHYETIHLPQELNLFSIFNPSNINMIRTCNNPIKKPFSRKPN